MNHVKYICIEGCIGKEPILKGLVDRVVQK